MFAKIVRELKDHAPFTALGTLSGIAIMLLFSVAHVPRASSDTLFWCLHPTHVLLSALVTAAMYRLNTRAGLVRTLIIGYVGSVGIATLSDSLIPYVGELLLGMPNRGIHLGFIEKWWLINPLVALGIIIACIWPRTRIPHAGHVFLSTWASLFHMTMASGDRLTPLEMFIIPLFLFLAVWLPCCTSDIVFPLLFTKGNASAKYESLTPERFSL
ncbi:hypothetical protein AMJ83_01900 [candidate division WOR_3 bacterium SM23_42]|uniref:Uncharacterized protein n=1 Tax=candidate division WOR_3 bacterium SM23_42 TaxID=1703779 RepID=A0A0S8FUX7_UNCW3|nr:MAG: hypothetical protein AMJ83_01900 [candidate division WOR_3 bacterium SM23_42]